MAYPHDGDLRNYRARPEGIYLFHADEILFLLLGLLALAIILDRVGVWA